MPALRQLLQNLFLAYVGSRILVAWHGGIMTTRRESFHNLRGALDLLGDVNSIAIWYSSVIIQAILELYDLPLCRRVCMTTRQLQVGYRESTIGCIFRTFPALPITWV